MVKGLEAHHAPTAFSIVAATAWVLLILAWMLQIIRRKRPLIPQNLPKAGFRQIGANQRSNLRYCFVSIIRGAPYGTRTRVTAVKETLQRAWPCVPVRGKAHNSYSSVLRRACLCMGVYPRIWDRDWTRRNTRKNSNAAQG